MRKKWWGKQCQRHYSQSTTARRGILGPSTGSQKTNGQAEEQRGQQHQPFADGFAASDATGENGNHQDRQERHQGAQAGQAQRTEFAEEDIDRLYSRQEQQTQRAVPSFTGNGV